MAGELATEDFEAGSAREKAQKAKLAAIEDERARMAADRASLPIYAHRWAVLPGYRVVALLGSGVGLRK